MASSMKKVLVLPGDNIGPEIIAEAVKVLETVNEKFGLGIELDYAHLGGAAWMLLVSLARRKPWIRPALLMRFC